MGNQQLLLFVLGIIITVTAVAVGLNYFSTSAADANRDRLISDLNFIAITAQSYYKKQSELGGGSNSFNGWVLPEYFENYESGKIKVQIGQKTNELKLKATGTEIGENGKLVEVEAIVRPTSVEIKIKH